MTSRLLTVGAFSLWLRRPHSFGGDPILEGWNEGPISVGVSDPQWKPRAYWLKVLFFTFYWARGHE